MKYTDSYGREKDIHVLRASIVILGILSVLVLILGGLVAAATLRQKRVNEAEIGVYYTDGPLEGEHFERILEPGDGAWVINDHVYKMPARQITWITGPGDEADASTLEFTVKDGEGSALMSMELSTRFVLNTTLNEKGEPFKTFFTGICQKFDCWEGSLDGTPGKDDGWNKMLSEIVGNPQRAAATAVGLRYEGNLLRYDSATQEQFADDFAEEFERLMADEIGVADIFCGPGYKRGDEDCPPVNVKVTRVVFSDPEREAIQTQRALAVEQQHLAADQEAAAIAQQRVVAAQATPEYTAQAQADAMRACANRDGCSLTVVISPEAVPGSIPLG